MYHHLLQLVHIPKAQQLQHNQSYQQLHTFSKWSTVPSCQTNHFRNCLCQDDSSLKPLCQRDCLLLVCGRCEQFKTALLATKSLWLHCTVSHSCTNARTLDVLQLKIPVQIFLLHNPRNVSNGETCHLWMSPEEEKACVLSKFSSIQSEHLPDARQVY